MIEVQDLLIYFKTAPRWYLGTGNLFVHAGQLVQRSSSTSLWGDFAVRSWSYVFGVVWWAESEYFVGTLFMFQPVVYSGHGNIFLEIKRNMSNNSIDTLCPEALTRYNDNHYDDNLEAVALSLPTSKSTSLYGIIYSLIGFLTDASDDDYFAHFADEKHCFYSVRTLLSS